MDHKPSENNKGGGVGIPVSEKIAQNTIEDGSSDEYENLEINWIQIESRPRNLDVGVFYGPQENDCTAKVTEAKTALNNQLIHKAENNEIILAEDFSEKIAISTKNSKQMRITKRQTTPKNHCRQKHDSSKPQSRYRHLDPGEQDEKLGEISHWLYISHTLYNQRNTNPHSGRRRASHSERGTETDHNTITMTIKMNDTRKPKCQERWMEPIQQSHPPRGKQEHNHEGRIQTNRKETKQNTSRHGRNEKDKNRQTQKN